jgi:hypothetical protein
VESAPVAEKVIVEPKPEKPVQKANRKSRKSTTKPKAAANLANTTSKSKSVKKVAAAKTKAKPKKTSATKPAATASKTNAKIVSMKDWVARGMASIEPPASSKKRGRK